jgi:site-specific recombinase XerD
VSKIIHLRDGEVVLYKRPNSSKWQTRFKLADGKWHCISAKSKNSDEAGKFACNAYDEARYRLKFDLPQVSRRFDHIAKLAIKAMEDELAENRGKRVYPTYISAIKSHLIPFFGTKYINNISQKEIDDYNDHQTQQSKKPLKASTINNHNASLRRIYDLAISYGWLTKVHIPQLKNSGEASKRRPHFTRQEWNTLTIRLNQWCKGGHKEETRMMRELLRDYVLILGNTGMRPGEESYDIKWKNIDWHIDNNGERHLRIYVDGKTKERQLIARHNTQNYLKRIQSRFPALAQMTFDELIKAKVDQYVFRLSNGKRTKNLNQSFKQFLTQTNMLKDPNTNQDRTLYSIRHMYATLALISREVDGHGLGRQMGTSPAMIDKHYSHLTPTMIAPSLSGRRFSPKKPRTENS